MGKVEETQEQTKAPVREIAVDIVISGTDVTEDIVHAAIVELVEKKSWKMGGIVKELTQDIADAKKEVDEMINKES